MRRTTPLSAHWGFERGTPVDRYYIERFLEQHRRDIRGRVLELMDTRYTTRFGVDVTQADVLDIDPANPQATITANLEDHDSLPSAAFDCFILTQTLQFVYDVSAALAAAHAALRTGGVLLATLPSVSKIDRSAGVDGDYWRFTAASATRLFGSVFGEDNVAVEPHGNVLTAVAFLMGMAADELKLRELELEDDFFPVVVCVRAVKPV
jgi:SAM-dependent methyltransferase